MNTSKTKLPYAIYYWQVGILALLGLVNSLYLVYTHYKNHTDIFFSSFCAITRAINCDTVAQSPWSIFIGLPVAIWGVFAYTLFLILLIPLRHITPKRVPGWSLLIVLALLYSCYSVYLGVVSAYNIHSWCVLCLLSYAINFLLALSSWIAFQRFSPSSFLTALKAALGSLATMTPLKQGVPILIILLIAVRFSIPMYWVQEDISLNPQVQTGVTEEGHPWIGASTPQFVIEEFTDYQCFQCKKLHFYLRQLINQYPERIRLIHRQYPLDHEFNRILVPNPFHIGSGKLALIATAAIGHDAFWSVNDALYKATQTKNDTIDLEQFADLMKISTKELAFAMYNENILKHLRHDIVQGLQHGITGTPAYVIDEKIYQGTLPTEFLKKIRQ